jgi:L-iditol 2-dehydrogenase
MPHGDVHFLSQLRPQLRRSSERAQGERFTTDGGFAQYAINHINTLIHVRWMSDEEATLIVTAGTAVYGLDAWAA